MKKWKKGIVLTTDREGLAGEIQCAECGGFITPGRRFYIEDYQKGYELNTRFFHFNCIQTPENRIGPKAELARVKENLVDVLSQRGVAEEEMAMVERDLGDLEREESCLRETIGKLVEGGM